MLVEENSSTNNLIVQLIIVGFHHKKGHQIEYSYPPIIDEKNDDYWSIISSLALPDGAHHREKDLIYFHISYENQRTLFGLSSYRQIDANTIENKEADVTRNSIQKSVCLLLRQPVYGNLSDEFELLTEKYFLEKHFHQRKLFEDFVEKINLNPPMIDFKYFSIRHLIQQFKRKTLILFKLILLQRKVLFMLSPIENLVKTILTLISLIPNLLEHGLYECTLIDENLNYEKEIHLNENEDIVFERNDEQINFDKVKLKTIKNDDDDQLSIQSSSSEQQFQINLLKRATSITTKLTDTFNRLTTTTTTTTNTTTTSIPNEYSQDLSHLDQFHFPLQLFNKNNNLHPYLSIHSLDLIKNKYLNSFVIGASNGLFRQQTQQFDIIIYDQDEDFLINCQQLKTDLQLTTADLRFIQSFEDEQGLKSEEELRKLFLNYFLSLLAVSMTPNDESLNDFNSSFVKSFQSTNAFRLWQSQGPYPYFEQIFPRHPQAGQLNVADVKLRVAHVLDDTETGRKLKGAFEDTSQFMGEKSRLATKVLGQAKNSLFSSLAGTINQGKQWLNKPSSSQND